LEPAEWIRIGKFEFTFFPRLQFQISIFNSFLSID
jgi:hypothetical protein